MSTRIEESFHDTIWGAANEFSKVENAIYDARQICEGIQAKQPVDVLEYVAKRWLEAYGHSWGFERAQEKAK